MTESLPVYTAHDVGDLFAALPTLFGFAPEESLVAVATSGPRQRLGMRLRQDLPPPHEVPIAAAVVATHLNRHADDGVILLVVGRDPSGAEALLESVVRRLDPRLRLVACGWADGRRYWEPVPGFPTEGVPYESSGHHLAVVEAVAAGQEILPDRAALVRRFAACAGLERRRMVAVTHEVLTTELPRVGSDPLASGLAVVDPVLAAALDDADRLTDRDCAVLALWVSSVDVRNEVWSRIEPATARAWLRVWTDVAGRVVPPFEPAVLCLAAYAAWLAGDGTQARIAAERAHAADERYPLAAILLSVLEAGVPPPV